MSNQTRKEDDWFYKFLLDRGLISYYKQLSIVKDWSFTIVIALFFATLFKSFFYETFKIPSSSMNPLLIKGDRVVVNKFCYGYSKFSFPFDIIPIRDRILNNNKPKRGDIVVFKTKLQENTNIYYIKRIIGLPNDKIKFNDNEIYVNGKKFEYEEDEVLPAKSKLNHNPFAVKKMRENNWDKKYNIIIVDKNSIAGNTREYVVPDGEYFCIGDNRDNSKDSRFNDIGTIPYKNIVGRAERILFSTANNEFNFDRIFKSIQAIKY